jgi:hypothetical protein
MDQKVTNPLGDNVTRAKALKAVRDGNLFRGPHPAVVLKYKETVGKHRNTGQINRQTIDFFCFGEKFFFLLTKLHANVSDL